MDLLDPGNPREWFYSQLLKGALVKTGRAS